MPVTDWTAIGALATGGAAIATALAAVCTWWMASKTRAMADKTSEMASTAANALNQDAELLDVSRRQVGAALAQARAAERQVNLMSEQIRVAQQTLIAASTPLLVPCSIVDSDKMPPSRVGYDKPPLAQEDGVPLVLPGNESLFIRLTDYPGRWQRAGGDLAIVVALRNVGRGPAILECAELAIPGRKRSLIGLANGMPIPDGKVYVTFRVAVSNDLLRLMKSRKTTLKLSVTYSSPVVSSKQWIEVPYWPVPRAQVLPGNEEGWLQHGAFKVGPEPAGNEAGDSGMHSGDSIPPRTPQGPAPPASLGIASEADGKLPVRLAEERLAGSVIRTGMFGTRTTGDTSGYGGLQVHQVPPIESPRPYGSYFDELANTLGTALESAGVGFPDAIERVVAHRGELTFHVRRERLPEVAAKLRDDPALRFELCSGVSGVHYPKDTGQELHAVYHLLSITHNRRVRLEVSAPDADPHIPSVVSVYPAANWHERETWDFFGIIFDGHPALTRIEMPDDWLGHPQRKDYPLGGIPVEYRGTTIPPPDERRHYA